MVKPMMMRALHSRRRSKSITSYFCSNVRTPRCVRMCERVDPFASRRTLRRVRFFCRRRVRTLRPVTTYILSSVAVRSVGRKERTLRPVRWTNAPTRSMNERSDPFDERTLRPVRWTNAPTRSHICANAPTRSLKESIKTIRHSCRSFYWWWRRRRRFSRNDTAFSQYSEMRTHIYRPRISTPSPSLSSLTISHYPLLILLHLNWFLSVWFTFTVKILA